ncbi:Homeodomain-like protein [Aspergillus falconensis]
MVLAAQAASNTTVSWNEIAASLPGRTNKGYRKRWHGTASAKANKGPWAEDEDKRLRNALQEHGPKWTAVASVVGSRLPDQCSKRWRP